MDVLCFPAGLALDLIGSKRNGGLHVGRCYRHQARPQYLARSEKHSLPTHYAKKGQGISFGILGSTDKSAEFYLTHLGAVMNSMEIMAAFLGINVLELVILTLALLASVGASIGLFIGWREDQ